MRINWCVWCGVCITLSILSVRRMPKRLLASAQVNAYSSRSEITFSSNKIHQSPKIPPDIYFSVAQLMENSHAALPNVGVCTFRQFTNMERSCMTTFFQGFRKDPHAHCSTKFTTLFGCFTTAVLKCEPTLTKSQARHVLHRANINKKTFCKDAGIQVSSLHPHYRVPCSDSYFGKASGCFKETLKLFRSNRGDTRLCSAYAEGKKCKCSLIDAECRFTGVAEELVELVCDDYNPFCEPSTPASIPADYPAKRVFRVRTEKNAVTSHLPKGVTFLIWAALIISVLW